jgi:hypothetical protein
VGARVEGEKGGRVVVRRRRGFEDDEDSPCVLFLFIFIFLKKAVVTLNEFGA